jgi:DNA primase
MDLIAEIKNQLPIVTLAEREGLRLKKTSTRTYSAVCPFHNEKKASLTFYADDNTFHCFGCGKHGDTINFYADSHNLSNTEAIKELARLLGLKYSRTALRSARRAPKTALQAHISAGKAERQTNPLRIKIFEGLRDYCGDLDPGSIVYLTGETRGLTIDTINHFGLFSITRPRATRNFLIDNFSLKELKNASLLSKGNRFLFSQYKIIIPIIENGQIIALRGRFFYKGTANPDSLKNSNHEYSKYKSTTGIANRLFNGDILKTLEKESRVFLCEAEFDAMILTQAGYNAVATLGVNNFNGELIARLNDFELVIAFDKGEEKAVRKASSIFYEQTGKNPIRPKEFKRYNVKDITELFIKKGK